MGTLLTTRRMAPELAARVEASVRRESLATGDAGNAPWKATLIAIARFGGVASIVAVAIGVMLLRRQDQREFERARAALLDEVHAASTSLTPLDEGAVTRMESWLVRSSGEYEGDIISEVLRPRGTLGALLARPSVYVRGTMASFAHANGIAEAAAVSLKDPLLVCLVEPPSSRAENALLAKVRDAYSSGAEQHSPHVRRFREAQAGLPFLLPAWADKVRSAASSERLDRLREEFEKAPIEGATQAAKASLFIVALDEPGESGAPTELDGERAHPVRVELVDLASETVLLRMRKRVDPSWISASKRPLYASGLDGCALAFDIREAVDR